jgi:hypothetical protein
MRFVEQQQQALHLLPDKELAAGAIHPVVIKKQAAGTVARKVVDFADQFGHIAN